MSTTSGHRLLPSGPVAVSTARREVSTACDGLPLDIVDIAALLTSELVTNAILHGCGAVSLVVDLDASRLLVKVTDAGAGRPRIVDRGRLASNGRGLKIVDTQADQWGCGHDDDGTTVWFELRLPLG